MQTSMYVNSLYAIVPPLLAIVLAVVSRRIILSLFVGIILGALMINHFDVFLTGKDIGLRFMSFIVDSSGHLNDFNLPVLLFLIFLGMTISLINLSGSTLAVAKWAKEKIKTRKQARLMTMLLGIIIFVDDYFNTLTVGTIVKPITDEQKVSREELAYGIDSTAGPICSLMPISSWGAYLIGIMTSILATLNIYDISPLTLFFTVMSMNYYAFFALFFLLGVILFNIQLKPMNKAFLRSVNEALLWNPKLGVPIGTHSVNETEHNQSAIGLIMPIGILIVSNFFFIGFFGFNNVDHTTNYSLVDIISNTDTTLSIFYSSILSVISALIYNIYLQKNVKQILGVMLAGAKSMLPAIYILLCAWTIAGIMTDLKTGNYLASLIGRTLPQFIIPALIFLLAGIAAFSTGTSWGTFAIMLPIAADIGMQYDVNMVMILMSAVISGSIFGDHSSPISDTTCLSATGAGCHHIDHVITQLPYAFVAAMVTLMTFLVLGITQKAVLSFVFGVVLLFIVIKVLSKKYSIVN